MFLLGMEKGKRRLTKENLTKWTKMNTALENDLNVNLLIHLNCFLEDVIYYIG